MGGSPSAKPETTAERNARILAAKRANKDVNVLQAQELYLKRTRMRSPLFGGPESGAAAPATMGGGLGKLGVN